jgi:hypothetical protein
VAGRLDRSVDQASTLHPPRNRANRAAFLPRPRSFRGLRLQIDSIRAGECPPLSGNSESAGRYIEYLQPEERTGYFYTGAQCYNTGRLRDAAVEYLEALLLYPADN